MSRNDERFTLERTVVEILRHERIPDFTLDVAACKQSHWAPRYFTKADDGLKQRWFGRVWCNPPFSILEPWLRKTWQEWRSGRVELVVMLLPTRTEQPWWHRLVEPKRDLRSSPLRSRFLKGRTRFGNPRDPRGLRVGSPNFNCCTLTWRDA